VRSNSICGESPTRRPRPLTIQDADRDDLDAQSEHQFASSPSKAPRRSVNLLSFAQSDHHHASSPSKEQQQEERNTDVATVGNIKTEGRRLHEQTSFTKMAQTVLFLLLVGIVGITLSSKARGSPSLLARYDAAPEPKFSVLAASQEYSLSSQTKVKEASAPKEEHPKPDISDAESDTLSETNVKIELVEPKAQSQSPPSSNTNLFLGSKEIVGNEIFSASWWQRTERFMELDIDRYIRTVEDDSFAAVKKAGRGREDARMARDFLDFSIEHLSKWWKTAGGYSLTYAQAKLANYTERVIAKQQDDLMKSTLAVVPYGVKDSSDAESKRMWGASLTATIASLVTHGIARIVVVGYYDADEELARRAFAHLSKQEVSNQQSDLYFETRIGVSELAFVRTADVNSTFITHNIPKGALKGLQDALAGRSENPTPYLGAPSADRPKYQYIYLTEADQILNARLSAEFLAEMDKGSIIIPHRLQPMPHPKDLEGLKLSRDIRSLPYNKTVIEIDAKSDSCCDTGQRLEEDRKICTAR